MRLSTMIAAVFLLCAGFTAAQAGSECNDGSYSQSSGSGTCSYHGGERK